MIPRICPFCGRHNIMQPCGSTEFIEHMSAGGNCSNCGHGLDCHPAKVAR